jgi:hypothetical protein
MNAAVRAIVFVATMLAVATPGWAAIGKTHWLCWLHADSVRAVCTVVDTAGAMRLVEHPAADATRLGQAQLMHAVRERPAGLRGQSVYVPLNTVPFDDTSVGLLMRSVLCGAAADCDARYHPDMGHLVAQAPELFADMNDPLLDSASR